MVPSFRSSGDAGLHGADGAQSTGDGIAGAGETGVAVVVDVEGATLPELIEVALGLALDLGECVFGEVRLDGDGGGRLQGWRDRSRGPANRSRAYGELLAEPTL